MPGTYPFGIAKGLFDNEIEKLLLAKCPWFQKKRSLRLLYSEQFLQLQTVSKISDIMWKK